MPYRVESVPFESRGAEHYRCQPFGQVPWITDGDLTVFESGAALLHVAERSEQLLPRDRRARADVAQWVFAALNSVEAASLPWFVLKFAGDGEETAERKAIASFLTSRLTHMEDVLSGRDWLTPRFSAADIAMADVLRLIDRFDGLASYPACKAYVTRAVERPAFRTAYEDQMAHFARGGEGG
ncbi:glutathione S-transferase family protein [Pseudooceanicola sp. LIPI14-2-Ac024]|uniref:glutathione S-transferase family protein n=1 Tax=Pseudooceanicola sp. LIPI14-2-Ac024 TaxID=3344875 RepID=UPI0035D09BE5